MPNTPITDKTKEKIIQLHNRNFSINGIAKRTGTSRPTVKKYIEQHNDESC